MRKFLIAAFAVSAMTLSGVSLMAKDKAAGDTVTGVLIDNDCSAKNKTEADASKHPKACAIKCGTKGGFALIHGDHVMKLDEAGNKMALKYLEGADATTTVTVTGTPDKEMTSIAVTDIKAAKAEKSEKSAK